MTQTSSVVLSKLFLRILFGGWAAVALPDPATPAQEPPARFPSAAPADVGLDSAGLEELAAFVRGLTDRGEVVGAELLLVFKDKTVLHRAFGWKDREEKVAMEPDTIFCVRSMTKPVAGTAVEILIDEKKLALSDKVAKHLASRPSSSAAGRRRLARARSTSTPTRGCSARKRSFRSFRAWARSESGSTTTTGATFRLEQDK
jgi:CubicO group peptidase (beta-lactamase class C family)